MPSRKSAGPRRPLEWLLFDPGSPSCRSLEPSRVAAGSRRQFGTTTVAGRRASGMAPGHLRATISRAEWPNDGQSRG